MLLPKIFSCRALLKVKVNKLCAFRRRPEAFKWGEYTQFAGVNMALGSQTVVYDEALFSYYFERLDENSTVILDPHSLLPLPSLQGPASVPL